MDNFGVTTGIARHWDTIERHPRLVFDKIGPDEEAIIGYYIAKGLPFTVVVGKSPGQTVEGAFKPRRAA